MLIGWQKSVLGNLGKAGEFLASLSLQQPSGVENLEEILGMGMKKMTWN
jgi:hypothetical protein